MSLPASSHPERRADDPWRQTTVDRRRPLPASRRPSPQRGWYPDPPALRYWDGEAWTVLTRPAGPPLAEELVRDGAADTEAPVRLEPPVAGQVATVGTLPVRQSEARTATLTALSPPQAGEFTEDRPTLRGQLLMLLWVALLALGAGAVVAALGIALTV